MLITDTDSPLDTASDAVVLRRAQASDTRALRRLADLDDSSPLAGAALVAERDGQLRAAISLHSGRAIADPFHLTTDLVALLRARADLLERERLPRNRTRTLLRRAARAV